jgi:hypothetical protein
MSNLPKASSLPNLWFDESGDLGKPTQGSPTTNFVVVCLYVPTYSYKACRKSMQSLLGRTPMHNRKKKGHGTKIDRKAVILQQLVIYDCKFGLIHINKETAKNYESFSASPDGKNTRTRMILYLLDCAIKTQAIGGKHLGTYRQIPPFRRRRRRARAFKLLKKQHQKHAW